MPVSGTTRNDSWKKGEPGGRKGARGAVITAESGYEFGVGVTLKLRGKTELKACVDDAILGS